MPILESIPMGGRGDGDVVGPSLDVAAVKVKVTEAGDPCCTRALVNQEKCHQYWGTENPHPQEPGEKEGSGPPKRETSPTPNGSEGRETLT